MSKSTVISIAAFVLIVAIGVVSKILLDDPKPPPAEPNNALEIQKFKFAETADINAKMDLALAHQAKVFEKAIQSRAELITQFLEERRRDQALAEKDRLKLANEKDAVKKEAEGKKLELRKLKTREQEKRLAHQIAMGPYQDSKTVTAGAEYANISKRFSYLKSVEEKWVKKLVSSPGISTGAINSGRGLNVLLDELGSAASSQMFAKSELKEDIANLEATILLHEQIATPATGMSEVDRDLFRKQEALKLLNQLDGHKFLSRSDYNKLTLRIGQGSKTMSFQGNKSPFHINWHIFEMFGRFECADLKKAIEGSKEAAIRQMKKNGYFDRDTILNLRGNLEMLHKDVEAYATRHVDHLPTGHFDQRHYYGRVKPEVKRMHRDLYILLNASSIDDIMITESLFPAAEKGNENDRKTVGELLAFMARNGLTVYDNPSGDTSAGVVHLKIHREMVEYFVKLNSLKYVSEFDSSSIDAQLAEISATEKGDLANIESKDRFLLEKKFDTQFEKIQLELAKAPNVNISGSNYRSTPGESFTSVVKDQATRTLTDRAVSFGFDALIDRFFKLGR